MSQSLKEAARILNSGLSRSLVLSGNVHDLHFDRESKAYQPLGRVLSSAWSVPGIHVLVYELNGPIRFASEASRAAIKEAWVDWKCGLTADERALEGLTDLTKKNPASAVEAEFEKNIMSAVGNPTVALELLRQLCLCSRTEQSDGGRTYLPDNLLILVEAADLLLPDAPIHSMSRADRHRVSVIFDWVSDPEFQNAGDSLVLIAESPSLLHHRIVRLPVLVTVNVPGVDAEGRAEFLAWFRAEHPRGDQLKTWATDESLVAATAGLSIHALRQLLIGALYDGRAVQPEDVMAEVARFIERELGEDVVEFKRPSHTLKDVVGFTRLKAFFQDELLPRFGSTGKDALPGAAVGGPIGAGKSFVFEALAAELDFPVLVLKNIRSQWFGQTDVLFERLRRTLVALGKVMIFVDEADTQFGGVGPDAHTTERRLTGKIQAMIADPALRGKVVWLLMTARIHLLSPDLRRPGRVGELILPVLDPAGEDRRDFLRWVIRGGLQSEADDATLDRLDALTEGYSAAAFAGLRSSIVAAGVRKPDLDLEDVVAIIQDQLPPDIEATRRYQTLQAIVNCTRRSLLPDPTVSKETREGWRQEIAALERSGIR